MIKRSILIVLTLLFWSTAWAQLPTSGLVAWYPFCGNTNDFSGNGYHLTNSGAVLTTDRFGNPNCAYHFNGVSDEMYHNPPLPTDAGNFTYTAWILVDTPGNTVIVENGNNNIDGYEMLVTGYILLSVGSDVAVIFGGVNQFLPVPITLHQWHQTVLRRRAASTFDFIVDTTLIGTFTATFNPTHITEDFAVGMDFTNGTNAFLGKLDDIAVYNRDLSDLEIRQLYHYNPDVLPFTLGNDTTLCSGTLTLVPSGSYIGDTYTWSTGSTATSAIVAGSGTYWLHINNSSGCQASDTINVSFGSIAANLGPDTGFCIGGSVTLSSPVSPPGAAYTWSTGSSAHSINVSTPGKYWLHVTYVGCSADDTINVTSTPPPVVSLGNDTVVCASTSLILSSTYTYFGATFTWNTGATTSTISPSVTGAYWLKVTKSGCSSSDTVNISFKPLPTVSLGPDLSFCKGNSATLSSAQPPAATYLWSNGTSGNSIIVSTAGTFWLKVTDNGCSSVDTINVIVNDIPTVDLGTDVSACSGQKVTIQSANNYPSGTYLWSTGSTSTYLIVSAAGIYSLAITKDGCTGTDTLSVSFKPLPIPIAGFDTTICEGDTIMLGGTSETTTASYLWNTGSTNPIIPVNAKGTYYVTKTVDGCSATAYVHIKQMTKPEIALPRDTTLCTGQIFVLQSLFAGDVEWSNGTNGTSISVDQPGIYWGTVTNVCGDASDTINITYGSCDIWFPSAFTPNDDGKNDIARAIGNLGAFRDYSLSIYNRWGQRIFYTSDIYSGWDGKFKGVDQNLGTYFYMITYSILGKKSMLKGDIELIR